MASKGLWIKCLNFSLVLTFLKKDCEHDAICETKSLRSSTSICLQNIPFSSAIFCNLLISTVLPTPLSPLKITD